MLLLAFDCTTVPVLYHSGAEPASWTSGLNSDRSRSVLRRLPARSRATRPIRPLRHFTIDWKFFFRTLVFKHKVSFPIAWFSCTPCEDSMTPPFTLQSNRAGLTVTLWWHQNCSCAVRESATVHTSCPITPLGYYAVDIFGRFHYLAIRLDTLEF